MGANMRPIGRTKNLPPFHTELETYIGLLRIRVILGILAHAPAILIRKGLPRLARCRHQRREFSLQLRRRRYDRRCGHRRVRRAVEDRSGSSACSARSHGSASSA